MIKKRLLVSLILGFMILAIMQIAYGIDGWYKAEQNIILDDINYSLAFDLGKDNVMIFSMYSIFYVPNGTCQTRGYYEYCFLGFRYKDLFPMTTEAHLVGTKKACIEYTLNNVTSCKKEIGKSCKNGVECSSGNCFHDVCTFITPVCGDGYCDGDELKKCVEDCVDPTTTVKTTTTTRITTTTTTTLSTTTTTLESGETDPNVVSTSNVVTTTLINSVVSESEKRKKIYMLVLIVSSILIVLILASYLYMHFIMPMKKKDEHLHHKETMKDISQELNERAKEAFSDMSYQEYQNEEQIAREEEENQVEPGDQKNQVKPF